MSTHPKIAFFGGEPLGVPALEKLRVAGIIPDLVVCSPDRPAGRGLKMQAAGPKLWAEKYDVEVFQPASYKDGEARLKLSDTEWDLFIVVAYNHILPRWLLDIPKKGTLNVHPSLLPKLRGPSPIRTAILENKPDEIGVSVMLLDEKMDHGPILEQKAYTTPVWPMAGLELDTILASIGGELLAEVVPAWLNEEIEPLEQEHAAASYTEKFKKGDNELQINPHQLPTGTDAFTMLCKIRAWQGIGDTFFMHENKRIKIKVASLAADNSLHIDSVIPEGKKEMTFDSFLQSLATK